MSSKDRDRLLIIGILLVLIGAVGFLRWFHGRSAPLNTNRPHPALSSFAAYSPASPSGKLSYHGKFGAHPTGHWVYWTKTRWNGDYRHVMLAQRLYFALLVILLAGLAWLISGVEAAFFSACLTVLTPLIVECAVVLDDHLLNMVNIAAAIFFIRVSRGFGKLTPSCLALLFIAASMAYTLMASTGVLAFAVIVFACAGAVIDAWIAEAPEGSSFKNTARFIATRWPAFLLVPIFLVFVLVAGRQAGPLAQYYLGEVETYGGSAASVDWAAKLLAYPKIIFFDQLGPALASASLVGLFLLFRNKINGRFLLAGWFLGLLIPLSLIDKKNFFYVFYAVMAAPVVAGVGLASLRVRGKRMGLAFFFIAVSLAGLAVKVGAGPSPKASSRYRLSQYKPLYLLGVKQTDSEFHAGMRRFSEKLRAQHPANDAFDIILPAPTLENEADLFRYYINIAWPRARLFEVHPLVDADELPYSEYGRRRDACVYLLLAPGVTETPEGRGFEAYFDKLLKRAPSDQETGRTQYLRWLKGRSRDLELFFDSRQFDVYRVRREKPLPSTFH